MKRGIIPVTDSDRIGGGSEKDCYAVGADMVGLIGMEYARTLEQLRQLRLLAKLGLPALRVTLRQFSIDERQWEWGLLAPRYDFHLFTRCADTLGDMVDDLPTLRRLQPGHWKELRRIVQLLRQHRLYVNDLQFLFRGDSEVVICDPVSVDVKSRWSSARTVDFSIKVWKEALSPKPFQVAA